MQIANNQLVEKKSNIEARPPLIAKHELKVENLNIKELVPIYREGNEGGFRNTDLVFKSPFVSLFEK